MEYRTTASPGLDPRTTPTAKGPAAALGLRAATTILLQATDDRVIGVEEERAALVFQVLMRAVEDLYVGHDSPAARTRARAREALWFILEGRACRRSRFADLLRLLGTADPAQVSDDLVRVFRWLVDLDPDEAAERLARIAAETQTIAARHYDGYARIHPWLFRQAQGAFAASRHWAARQVDSDGCGE